MTSLLILLGIPAAIAAWFLRLCLRAPEGYQMEEGPDEGRGWHPGRDPRDVPHLPGFFFLISAFLLSDFQSAAQPFTLNDPVFLSLLRSSVSVTPIAVDGWVSFAAPGKTLGGVITTNDVYASWYTNSANSYLMIVSLVDATTNTGTFGTNGIAAPAPFLTGASQNTQTPTNTFDFQLGQQNGLQFVFSVNGAGAGKPQSNAVVSAIMRTVAANDSTAKDFGEIDAVNGHACYMNMNDAIGLNGFFRMENYDLTAGPAINCNYSNSWNLINFTWFATNQSVSNYVTVWDATNTFALRGRSGFPVDGSTGVDLRASKFKVGPQNLHGAHKPLITNSLACVWWTAGNASNNVNQTYVLRDTPVLPIDDPKWVEWAAVHDPAWLTYFVQMRRPPTPLAVPIGSNTSARGRPS